MHKYRKAAVFVCNWRYVRGSLDNCSEAQKCKKECALRKYMESEEEELPPEEMDQVAEGERELKAGSGIKYEQSIWDDLDGQLPPLNS